MTIFESRNTYDYSGDKQPIRLHWNQGKLMQDKSSYSWEPVKICFSTLYTDAVPMREAEDIVLTIYPQNKKMEILVKDSNGEQYFADDIEETNAFVVIVYLWYGNHENVFYCGPEGYFRFATDHGDENYRLHISPTQDYHLCYSLLDERTDSKYRYKYKCIPMYSDEVKWGR